MRSTRTVSPLATVYLAILVILIALTIAFTVVALFSGQWLGAVYAIAIALLLVVAYWTEGSEMAATTLQDKDVEQVDATLRSAVQTLQDKTEEIFSGQQFLAVAAVVLLTNCCVQLARLPIVPNAASPDWFHWAATYLPRLAPFYESLFPILVVFWVAELLPRFIAKDRPVDVFSRLSSLGIMKLSERLGSVFDLAAPSKLLRDWFIRNEANTSLLPTRRSLYETIATFRDGIGIETATITLTIEPNGALLEIATFEIKAYRGGICKVIEQQDICDAPITATTFEIDTEKTTYRGRMRSTRFPSIAAENQSQVDWELRFPEGPLELHDVIAYKVVLRAEPGAFRCGDGVPEHYEYTIEKIPMKQLIIQVSVSDTSQFYIGDLGVEVHASYQPEINIDEAKRIKPVQLGTGGRSWQFTVNDPLPPLADYKFKWTFYNGAVQGPGSAAASP